MLGMGCGAIFDDSENAFLRLSYLNFTPTGVMKEHLDASHHAHNPLLMIGSIHPKAGDGLWSFY